MASLTIYGGTPGEVVVTPELLLGWDAAMASRTVLHEVLNRSDPDVTLRPAATATGTLELFFADLATAQAAQLAHAQAPGPWYLDGAPDEPLLIMWYVVAPGALSLRIDVSAVAAYVVSIPYRVVVP